MSRSSTLSRQILAGALLAAATCGVSAAPAQAASKTLTYQCKYPILGTEPLSIAMELDIPGQWPRGVDTPPFAISAVATAGGDTSRGLALIDDLTSIEGLATASSTVFLPQGGSQRVKVPITVANYVIPAPAPDPLVLTASGVTPSLIFDEPGAVRITLDSLALNLTVRDSFGDPIVLPPVTRDIDGNRVTDSDGDPNTFDVYCKLDDGQSGELGSPELASIEIGPDCVSCAGPTMPIEVEPELSDYGPSSFRLRWGASTSPVGIKEYVIRYEGGEVRVPGDVTEKLIEGANLDFFEITAVDNNGNESEPLVLLVAINCGCASPFPGEPTGTPTETSVALAWAASPAPGVQGYDVFKDDVKVATVTGTSVTVTGLSPETDYVFKVEAFTESGGRFVSPRTTVRTKADATAPTDGTLTGRINTDSVSLEWTAATDNVGVIGYDVYRGETLVSSVTGTTATLTGLAVGGNLTLRVVAKDAAGNRSSGATLTLGSIPSPLLYRYSLAGSTAVKTLTKGTLPLKGSIDARLTIATGAFSADLTLADTQGRLTALGFLPVTAKIGFVPSGKTTGTLLDGVLKTKSLVRIKVKEVKLFGAIPLAGGNNCQTKQLSEINLQSTDAEFKPLQGGPIAGTYRISDLNGCGVLNGLVSPLTAGAGNTINAVLTPNP